MKRLKWDDVLVTFLLKKKPVRRRLCESSPTKNRKKGKVQDPVFESCRYSSSSQLRIKYKILGIVLFCNQTGKIPHGAI